jgi:hypothetical protein
MQREYVDQLTYPDIASETNGEEGSKDYNSLGPELITVLVPPISVRLHQEDATSHQLFQKTNAKASLQHESIDWHLSEHAGEGEMLFVSSIRCKREEALTATGANEAAATSSGSCARD